jgi:SsrA-binding protein
MDTKGRGDKTVITNRKARHDYFVVDSFEAGIVLKGSEVKSIRDGKANLQDAYARVVSGEIFLFGMHVLPYEYAHNDKPDPLRVRKLLLHRKQILEIERETQEQGITLIPLRVFFVDGRVKVDLAIAKGKAHYDKRQSLAARDAKREAERAMKGMRD